MALTNAQLKQRLDARVGELTSAVPNEDYAYLVERSLIMSQLAVIKNELGIIALFTTSLTKDK